MFSVMATFTLDCGLCKQVNFDIILMPLNILETENLASIYPKLLLTRDSILRHLCFIYEPNA